MAESLSDEDVDRIAVALAEKLAAPVAKAIQANVMQNIYSDVGKGIVTRVLGWIGFAVVALAALSAGKSGGLL